MRRKRQLQGRQIDPFHHRLRSQPSGRLRFRHSRRGRRRHFPVGKRDAQGHAQRQGAGSCGQCRQAGTTRRAYRLGIDSRPYAYRRPPDQ